MKLTGNIAFFLARLKKQKMERAFSRADQSQRVIFSKLMKSFDGSMYARQHAISAGSSYDTFAKNVPVVTYEEFFPVIESMLVGTPGQVIRGTVRSFAKSSGTTNAKSKYIPLTPKHLDENHYQAGRDMITWAVAEYKNTKILKGKMLGTTGNFCTDALYPHARIGDLSAHLVASLPWYAGRTRVAEPEVFVKEDWKEKVNHLVSYAVKEDVRMLVGTPTWMLVLLDEALNQTSKAHITQVWPNLSIFFHGAVNFTPYQKVFAEKVGKPIDYMNIYNASEGFIGFQYRKTRSDEFVLLTNHDIFYECILMSDYRKGERKAIPLSQVKLDREYALVITTGSGLVRYILGDTVVFTNKSPYLFRLTGRTKQSLNAFGEEVCVENIDQALAHALSQTQAEVAHYTVSSVVENGMGYHQWAIEFSKEPKDIDHFISLIDEQLKELNSDYEAKRAGEIMRIPEIYVIRDGTFMRWLESRGKLGGQHKIPLLSDDPTFLQEIICLHHE